MRGFVETSISRQIADATAYACDACQTAAISGPPGIGKTFALQHIAERNSMAAYWSVPQARSTLKAATKALRSAASRSETASPRALAAEAKLKRVRVELSRKIEMASPVSKDAGFVLVREEKALLDAFGYQTNHEHTSRLWQYAEDVFPSEGSRGAFLIVDEAQRLDLNILVEVVDFPARFGLPVVIAGNPELLKRTRSHGGAFDQIASRCAKRVVLRRPLADDLLSIAVDFDVYGEDAREAAISYGLQTSIRELVFMLTTARGLADRGPVRVAELRQAAVFHKGGSDALALLKPAA